MRGRLLVLASLATVGLCVPPAAGASVYCVGAGTACTFTYAGDGTGLQAALDDADTNIDVSGGPDTVRIVPGAYFRAAGFHTTGGALAIEGAGQGTVLTTDAA